MIWRHPYSCKECQAITRFSLRLCRLILHSHKFLSTPKSIMALIPLQCHDQHTCLSPPWSVSATSALFIIIFLAQCLIYKYSKMFSNDSYLDLLFKGKEGDEDGKEKQANLLCWMVTNLWLVCVWWHKPLLHPEGLESKQCFQCSGQQPWVGTSNPSPHLVRSASETTRPSSEATSRLLLATI